MNNTQNGEIDNVLNDRIRLKNSDNKDTTVVRTDWNGDKKQWLTTNFENTKKIILYRKELSMIAPPPLRFLPLVMLTIQRLNIV